MSDTTTTTADDVRAVAYIVEDIEALGVHVASASWVGYTDHPLTVQVSGDEAAVDTVAAALDLDPDDGTSANYVRMSGRVLVYSGRSVPPCTLRRRVTRTPQMGDVHSAFVFPEGITMQSTKPRPVWASVEEVAEHIHVSALTVRRRIASGEFRAYRVGKSHRAALRLDLNEVDAAMRPVPAGGAA